MGSDRERIRHHSRPPLPYDLSVTTTVRLLTILKTHTGEFNTGPFVNGSASQIPIRTQKKRRRDWRK